MNNSSKINRKNNFDFLRLMLASMVIISHSYPLTNEPEIFANLTNHQLDLGSFAVNTFFILSGYFIFISLRRSKSVKNYLSKRLLRLYPALLVLMLISLITLPFVYTGQNIFMESSYWLYAPNALSLYHLQHYINGVFSDNPYPESVNGSLWSLSYEFTLYIGLVLFYFIKNQKVSVLLAAFIFIASWALSLFKPNFLTNYFSYAFLDTNQLYRLSVFFFAGSLLSFFNLSKINKLSVRLLLALIILISIYFGNYKMISPFILPPLILLLGLLATPIISSLSEKVGDISYGVYIYGFLVQQFLMNYFSLSPLFLMSLSLPITFILAYLSWHFVEEKMMRFKNVF